MNVANAMERDAARSRTHSAEQLQQQQQKHQMASSVGISSCLSADTYPSPLTVGWWTASLPRVLLAVGWSELHRQRCHTPTDTVETRITAPTPLGTEQWAGRQAQKSLSILSVTLTVAACASVLSAQRAMSSSAAAASAAAAAASSPATAASASSAPYRWPWLARDAHDMPLDARYNPQMPHGLPRKKDLPPFQLPIEADDRSFHGQQMNGSHTLAQWAIRERA